MKLIKIFSVALLLLVSSFANAKAQEAAPFCEVMKRHKISQFAYTCGNLQILQ